MRFVQQQWFLETGSNIVYGLWMMQTLKSRLDNKAVDKNYVAEKWSISIDAQQEQMLLLNCMFDRLSTGQHYLFSRAKLALDSVCTQ